MKRIESNMSHSGRKNSKWLHENLQEMDHLVKRMLKLIDEDADSFARKAQLYFKKRPDLLSLVDEFYRMYRSLAERYDLVTGELRKNIPSDLQSQGSGVSDMGSEPPSTMASLDRRPGRTKSEPRAAGFHFFLGSSGSGSDLTSKEGDESSTLDSEWDSDDDSSVNNYSSTQSNGDEQGLRRRVLELEAELHEVKENLRSQTEDISEGLKRDDRKSFEFPAKIAACEEELRVTNQNMKASREEMTCLRTELEKYKSWGDSNGVLSEGVVKGFEILEWRALPDQNRVGEVLRSDGSSEAVQSLERELRITKDKLHESEDEAARLRQEIASKGSSLQNLQDQLKSIQKEVSIWKNKLEREKREGSKLLDRIVRYKTNLSDRDHEIRGLKEAIGNANKSLAKENEKLQAEMTRKTKERAYLEDNLKELDLRCQSLEAEVRRVKAAKAEMEVLFGAEIEHLNNNLEELKVKYDMLMAVKDDLTVKMSSKDDQMAQMSQHLHRLQVQHAELIASTEEACKSAEELGLRV